MNPMIRKPIEVAKAIFENSKKTTISLRKSKSEAHPCNPVFYTFEQAWHCSCKTLALAQQRFRQGDPWACC